MPTSLSFVMESSLNCSLSSLSCLFFLCISRPNDSILFCFRKTDWNCSKSVLSNTCTSNDHSQNKFCSCAGLINVLCVILCFLTFDYPLFWSELDMCVYGKSLMFRPKKVNSVTKYAQLKNLTVDPIYFTACS